jgi:hypothetical protein
MNRIGAVAWILGLLLLPVKGLAQIPAGGGNIINTIVGGAIPTGSALSVDIGDAFAMVEDGQGNIYFSSQGPEYVFKMNTSGNLTIYAGLGYEGLANPGGLATSTPLLSPAGLALDARGDLLVADYDHVWAVNATTGKLVNLAGNSTAQNYIVCPAPTDPCGDGGPATQAEFYAITGVALGGTGKIFIADTYDYRIRVIQSGIINAFAGNGNVCPDPTANPACGDGGPATDATFNAPQGVAVDLHGNVYVADSLDNRIRCVIGTVGGCGDTQHQYTVGTILTVAGNGYACNQTNCGDGLPATQANLFYPTGVFVDTSGNLYIADDYEGRVRIVNAITQVISTVAGPGGGCPQQTDVLGDGCPATEGSLAVPSSVFLDSSGHLLITDSRDNRIREVSGGIINTIAGGASGGDNGPATAAVLSNPYTLTVDSSGNALVVDTTNSRIRRVDAVSRNITTIAGTGNAGDTGDNGPATSATLNYPTGIALDQSGDYFIADPGSKVIRRVDGQTKIITTYAGTAYTTCPLDTDPCGDGGPATSATFADPETVTVDAEQNLFIADTPDNRIRCVIGTVGGCGDAQHEYQVGTILTVAGTGNPCTSSPACGDGGPATSANLSFPYGVAIDSSGNLLIADTADNLVRRVDAHSQIISTIALNGSFAFSGDGGPALDASLAYPTELALDPAGNLFISSQAYEVVQRVDAATQTISTVAGNLANPGIFGFSGDGGLATRATIDDFGLALDSSGNLYIADTGNNRIRFVTLAPTPSASPSQVSFGNQFLDTTSNPVPVTLTNLGGGDLLISQISTTGEFAQTNNCGSLLGPSQSCTINVTFTPTRLGLRRGLLKISDNAGNGTQAIDLSGTGVGK